MDFKELKAKAKQMQEKASEYADKAIKASSEKLASSSLTISTKDELDKFIKKSENSKFTNKETWEEKTFTKRVIIIFWEEKSDFFKEALYILPVLISKAFTQNISLKLAKSDSKNIKISDYKIKEIPSLVVFENKKVYKIVTWKENILKLVKSVSLDINSEIEKY